MVDLPDLARLARDTPRDELPELLGAIVEAEARVRLRLAEVPAAPASTSRGVLTVDEAAEVAGTSKRWLLSHTTGLAFRRDLSRKQPRFDEAGLRAWLARRAQ
jgi:hypothetical protein